MRDQVGLKGVFEEEPFENAELLAEGGTEEMGAEGLGEVEEEGRVGAGVDFVPSPREREEISAEGDFDVPFEAGAGVEWMFGFVGVSARGA